MDSTAGGDRGERPGTTRNGRRPPFRIANMEAPSSKVTHLELPVGRLPTDSMLSLPVAVIHGSQSGPTVWLSAAIHGDELNGVPVIRGLLRRVEPRKLRGTIILVPVVNVFGLINGSRYLPDGRDLNRAFPGTARGSLAAQIAHLFITEVVDRCEFGIDLHSGSGGRTNLPQLRCDLDDPTVREAANRFGAPVALHSKLRDGSLREAARQRGTHVLLYETGEAGRFDSDGIALGVEGTWRVLAGMGILEPSDQPPGPVAHFRKSTWVRAKRGGFCEMRVRLGQRVAPGETLAVVYDASSRGEQKVASHVSGLVIGLKVQALVNRGDALAHIAQDLGDAA